MSAQRAVVDTVYQTVTVWPDVDPGVFFVAALVLALLAVGAAVIALWRADQIAHRRGSR